MRGGRRHGTGANGLSARDRERLKVLLEVEEGHLKQAEVVTLRLSDGEGRRLRGPAAPPRSCAAN
jgi:hypothetical protein